MAVPKSKISKSRRGMRRSHQKRAVQVPTLASCSQCNMPKRSHHVCPHCGFYKGKEVIATAEEF